MKYEIKSNGSSKIGAALAQLCAVGKSGEFLVVNGVTQSAVSLFGARLACKLAAQGKDEKAIAEVFDVASIANASALKQALADCELVFVTDEEHQAHGGRFLAPAKDAKEGEPAKRVQLLVSAYWETKGTARSAFSLSALADL